MVYHQNLGFAAPRRLSIVAFGVGVDVGVGV
jgi:hypothetical protein